MAPSSPHDTSVQSTILEATVVEAVVVESTAVDVTAVEATAVEATAVEATVVDTPTVPTVAEPRSSQAPAASTVVEDFPLDSPTVETLPRNGKPASESGGGLVVSRSSGNFKSFLAPLKPDTFKQVVNKVERDLQIVNQTLTMLDVLNDNQRGFEAVLEEMLESIALKTGELLNADRTTIWLLDREKGELWSKVAKGMPELRVPSTVGIAGEVATFRRVVNIPYDFYNDPRSTAAKQFDQQSGYRTYTMLVMPLLDEATDELIAVVQLINKLKPEALADAPLAEKIDLNGFTHEDEEVFRDFAPSIRLILESSRAFYAAAQRQRAANALMKATQALSKGGLDLEETLSNVMDQAKELMQADRSTLWLLDEQKNQLWTKLPVVGEIRIPATGSAFASQVAQSGEPLLIPFDLYDRPDSQTAQDTDKRSKYRTCSMLCMPVFNSDRKLIGVTQLINKLKQGDNFEPYDHSNWPEAPEQWRASFGRSDLEFMETFNIQAGVALQNAKLFAEVKQQEQMQKDILRSLSDGVISTDKNGRIVAVNDSARELLGLDPAIDLEGRPLIEAIRVKDKEKVEERSPISDRFGTWLQNALMAGGDEKQRRQYYPDQILLPSLVGQPPQDEDDPWADNEPEEEHAVNLSLNTIADASDANQVRGALLVMEDISDEKRLKSTMYRYMTQELAEQLLSSGETKLGGDRKDVSVLFTDIRSYTSLTEKLQAEEVVAMLNEYFEVMVESIFNHKGTLDKYIGDAIMAVFGSPLPLEDHAWMALQTAVDMRYRLIEFNQHRRAQNKQEISIGLGLHSDEVISGNIGSSRRMEFTAIGDGVNLASRLEGATKQYGCDILISENTYNKCGGDRLWARRLDLIAVKGKEEAVAVYEVLALRDGPLARPISDAQHEIITTYAEGLDLYRQGDFRTASDKFQHVLSIDPTDKAANLQFRRCEDFAQHPPLNWDGVFRMTTK